MRTRLLAAAAVAAIAATLWQIRVPVGGIFGIFRKQNRIYALLDARACPPFSSVVRENVDLLRGSLFSRIFFLTHHRPYPPLEAGLRISVLSADVSSFLGEENIEASLTGFEFPEGTYLITSACSSKKLIHFARGVFERSDSFPVHVGRRHLVIGNEDGMECLQLELSSREWRATEKPVSCDISAVEPDGKRVDLVRGEFVLLVPSGELARLRTLDPNYVPPLAENLFYRWRSWSADGAFVPEQLEDGSKMGLALQLDDADMGKPSQYQVRALSNGTRIFARDFALDETSTDLLVTSFVALHWIEDVGGVKVQYEAAMRKLLYRSLGIKRVYRDEESSKIPFLSVDECSKTTQRCFPSIVDDMPDYLYRHRWTPPCCLENLRTTLKHVVTTLNLFEVRHWLEGGSLLGAVRHGDIIPWDSDVDLGVYEVDLSRCPMFSAASLSPTGGVVDAEGFLWEKASEGDFFRVHFSVTNRLHVDIFPFRVNASGFMTKDTWFDDHKQDCPFPEEFLFPRKELDLGGVKVYGPRNALEFLEFKFGEGVVDNPQYARPDLMLFP